MRARLNDMADKRHADTLPVDWVRVRQLAQDAAYVALSTLMWAGGVVLGVLGCGMLVFLLLSGGNMEGFFFHIDNLASRYVEADAARRAAFNDLVMQGFMVLLAAAVVLRGPAFVRRLRAGLARRGDAA